jgi:NAD(P)-dependent dehydrogenase (short-subunit alcohol dehydrogenase family)
MDISNLFSLKGRTALITGGSRGIGRFIAQAYLMQGARVYISARGAEGCDRAAAELSEYGEVFSLPADVSTLNGAQQLTAAYAKCEGSLDILVNNAGTAWGAPFDEFPEAGWDKVIDLNLKTPFFLTQCLMPFLRKASAKGLPKVINIASVDGISVGPRETYSYAASKAGLIQLTRLMALRLAPERIVVSAIAPGAFATDLNKSARDHGDDVAAYIPLGRIGTPEDLAGAAVYLASRAGDYVVGSTLIVDGGATHAR